jgi:hypothetical protein
VVPCHWKNIYLQFFFSFAAMYANICLMAREISYRGKLLNSTRAKLCLCFGLQSHFQAIWSLYKISLPWQSGIYIYYILVESCWKAHIVYGPHGLPTACSILCQRHFYVILFIKSVQKLSLVSQLCVNPKKSFSKQQQIRFLLLDLTDVCPLFTKEYKQIGLQIQ